MIQKTFKRCENKYLLNASQFKAVMLYLPLYMKPDTYSEGNKCYSIYNIYYDTEKDDIIRNSLSKPYYKEKLRMRSYTIPSSPEDIVYLELKKKIGKEVSKRRASMPLHEAEDFITTGTMPQSDNYVNAQVVQEISEFLARHKVSPKVFISYERMAYYGLDDASFRVTFDKHLTARRGSVTLEDCSSDTELIDDSTYLMEVKISGAVPLWLAHVLAANHIYSSSFSKYGTEYKHHCLQNQFRYLPYREERYNA